MSKYADKIIMFLTNPKIRFGYLSKIGFYNFLSDEKYIERQYKISTGKKLDLVNPQSYNEKLQWLKLYDRCDKYTTMVDKYEAKSYIAKMCGVKYCIPLLGVWSNVDEIDFGSLPKQFVLKTTHDSGGVLICTDKDKFEIEAAKSRLKKLLDLDYYRLNREWPYKNVPHRIIAEKYMVDESGKELKDYKIFCFNGKPRLIEVDFERYVNHRRNIYTTNWEYMDVSIKYPSDPAVTISRPKKLEKMLELASILSKDIPQLRVDFYSIGEEIFVGEMTFFHASGMAKFQPESLNMEMGSWIVLPNKGKR